MKIDRKDTIAGYPVLKIRGMFQAHDAASIQIIMEEFKADEVQAKGVLKTLQQLGYVESEMGKSGKFLLTMKGNALRQAKAIPSINRKKADEIFAGFMERVKNVNNDSPYVYKVTSVIVFGSYLKEDIPFVNDIDIIIEYGPKFKDTKAQHLAESERINSSKGVRNVLDTQAFPMTEVVNFLRDKNKYLSFHTRKHIELETTDYKQFYP